VDLLSTAGTLRSSNSRYLVQEARVRRRRRESVSIFHITRY
jgi:hypothetical protein